MPRELDTDLNIISWTGAITSATEMDGRVFGIWLETAGVRSPPQRHHTCDSRQREEGEILTAAERCVRQEF